MKVENSDVNDAFNNYTVDQLRSYVLGTRKEIRVKQDELRQLVGNRYHDLVSASDMIVEMGSVCKDLLAIYDRPSAQKLHSDSFEHRREKALSKQTGYVEQLLHTCIMAPQEIWQWMDGAMYLEATMTYLQAQGTLMEARQLLAAGNTSDGKGEHQQRQANRLLQQLKSIPSVILQQSTQDLSKLQPPPPSVPSPAFLSHYCEFFCSILLLKDLPFDKALQEFLQMRTEYIKECITAASLPSSNINRAAEQMLLSIQSVLRFLHAVFFTHTMSINPLGAKDLTGATGDMRVLTKVYWTVSSLSTSSPVAKAVQSKLNEPLPSKVEVERLCTAWVQQMFPLVLEGLKNTLMHCNRVREITDLEGALLQLISSFSASYSEGPDVVAGCPLPKSIWDGVTWEKGISQLINEHVQQLMKDMLSTLKTNALHRLREQPDWSLSPLQRSFTDLGVSPYHGDGQAWCPAVISDKEVSARYSLGGGQATPKDISNDMSLQLPTSLLDPSIAPLAHDVCADFYTLFATVLADAGLAIWRERQSPFSSANNAKLESLLHQEIMSTLDAVCVELEEVSHSSDHPEERAAIIGYTSQGVSCIIESLGVSFLARLSTKPTSPNPSILAAKLPSSVEWRKEDWDGTLRRLHKLYMDAHSKWIEETAHTIHQSLDAGLLRSYLGPDSSICKKLHASTWVIKRGEDGSFLNLPCMPQAYALQAMYNASQAIRSQNISTLRVSVVHELHRQLAALTFNSYLKFVTDPATALGYTDVDGVDTTRLICEEGWLQLLFDVRFLGSLLLKRPHGMLLNQADSNGTLAAEENAYVTLYRPIEESIDLINWNVYATPFEGILNGFLHSVSILFACHAVDHQPWAKKEKEKEGTVQREKDERVSLLVLAPECERFSLLPLLPLNAQAGIQAALRNVSLQNNSMVERPASSVTPAPAPAAAPAIVGSGPVDGATAAKLVSKISGVTGVKKLWGMFDKA